MNSLSFSNSQRDVKKGKATLRIGEFWLAHANNGQALITLFLSGLWHSALSLEGHSDDWYLRAVKVDQNYQQKAEINTTKSKWQ